MKNDINNGCDKFSEAVASVASSIFSVPASTSVSVSVSASASAAGVVTSGALSLFYPQEGFWAEKYEVDYCIGCAVLQFSTVDFLLSR